MNLISQNAIDNTGPVNFPLLLGEILSANRLISRYSQVRYQFNVVDSKDFYSDSRQIRLILKHLVINVFQASSLSEDGLVNVDVTCNASQSVIEVRSNKGFADIEDPKNFLRNMFFQIGLSRKAMSRLNLAKEFVEKLKGTFRFSISQDTGTVIHVVLPNLLEKM